MNENVESYFKEMNDFSMRLLNSSEFKKNAIVRLPAAYEEKKGISDIFSKMYLESYQMIQKDYNVGVVVDNEYYMWMGSDYYISRIPDSDISVYKDMEKNEKPYIKHLDKNEYMACTAGKRYEQYKEKEYITLSRSMDNQKRYENGRAILEVMVEAQSFREHIKKISGNDSGNGMTLDLYDSEGKSLYRESELDASSYVKKGERLSYKTGRNRVDIYPVFDGKLTAVYAIDTMAYYNKLLSFLGIAAAISLFFCLVIMLITYKISEQISRPIHKMCENVGRMNLEKGIHYEEVGTDIDEMEILSHSLRNMSLQLGESLERIIVLKDYEIHAKMLALQAQMQPHFLFNTLTTMGTMAEESGNRNVAAMCTNLTAMFRYISTEDSGGVKMFEEIRYVERYVDIMKERFPDARVEIDIPLELMGCVIPKLTIQPLVENAFKYCNRNKPEILVRGCAVEGDRWKVEVQDNGDGFPKEKVEEIMYKCRDSLKEEKTLSNKIDGMGLVNVYVRMKLFYGDSVIYHIEEGSSRIVIGGRL